MQRCRLRAYRPIPLRGFGNPSSKALNYDDYDKVRTFFDDDDDDYYYYYYGDDHIIIMIIIMMMIMILSLMMIK